MKGRMSTNYWAGKKKVEISRIAKTFLKPSKNGILVRVISTGACSPSECSGCGSCKPSCVPCTACEG